MLKISTVDWCEPNYDVVPFFAEFWNVISSLWICFLGVIGIFLHKNIPCCLTFSFPYLFIGMILVGGGSALFHGTLTWVTQLMDEIPMLLIVAQAIISLDQKRAIIWYSLYLTTTIVYIYTQFYPIFLLKFIGGICHIVYLYHTTKKDIRPMKVAYMVEKLIWIFATCYSVGLTCWIAEHIFCESYGHYYLHALWHIISGFGSYHGSVALMLINLNNRNRRTKIVWVPLPIIKIYIPSKEIV